MIVMDFPNAVSSPAAFYNRQTELDQALSILRADRRVPVVIIGERRIGKTSLQNVTMECIRQENPSLVLLQIDPRTISTVDLFAEALLRQLNMHLKCDIRETGLYDEQGRFHVDAPDRFDLAVQRILPPGWSGEFILCIDEFDEIVRLATNTGEVERERLFDLIHHLVERSPLPLRLFFTMTRVPDPMKAEIPSPLITKSQIIELQPMSEAETQGMIDWLLKDTQISLFPAAKERLVYLSGGHPYFIKLLVSNLAGPVPPAEEGPIGLMELEKEVLPRALEDPRARYAIENIWKAQHFNPGEKSVLLYLAERGEPVGLEEFRLAGREIMRAVRSLSARHYLVEQEGRYSTRIHFLEYWFRDWAEFEEELERLNVHHMVGAGDEAALTDEISS